MLWFFKRSLYVKILIVAGVVLLLSIILCTIAPSLNAYVAGYMIGGGTIIALIMAKVKHASKRKTKNV